MRAKKLTGSALLVLLTAALVMACRGAPEELALATFRAEVVPVLEARCAAAACHGLSREGIALGESPDDASYVLSIDDKGKISDVHEAHRQSLRFVNTAEDPRFSSILRRPLPREYGGAPHGGGVNFVSPEDPAYLKLLQWIRDEPAAGGENPAPVSHSPERRFFDAEVHPHLMARGCAISSCHGPSSFVSYRLQGGIVDNDRSVLFSEAMLAENYALSRKFLAFDGVPEQSRLIKKGLPLDQGGMMHRGGNRTFFTGLDDPAVEALLTWARKEREALAGDAAGDIEGLVFIRGSVAQKTIGDAPVYQPGADIFLRLFDPQTGLFSAADEINLTGHLHGGEADIRHPALSKDGNTLAFVMSRGADDGYQIYVLDLRTGDVRRRTQDPPRTPSGALLTNLMPTFGPSGELYFVSNRHGHANLNLYRLDAGSDEPRRLGFGPTSESRPRHFRVGAFQNYVVLAHHRHLGSENQTVGFSFPVDLHVDYHIFFGVTSPFDHHLEFNELPDGRAVTVGTSLSHRWGGGALAILDRSLGPDLDVGVSPLEAAPPGYAQAFHVLDEAVSVTGISAGGIYRDPRALPDGSLVVAWAPGPIDVEEVAASPRFRLLHLVLREAPRGCASVRCAPDVAETRTLVDDGPGSASVHSPLPVYRRVVALAEDIALDPTAPTLFSINDAPVNQAVLERLSPHGPRVLREARGVRLVEALPDVAPRSPSLHLPARILAEFPLEADGSAHVIVPAETAFRVQLLDADGMALGVQHNRWLFNWPGQHFSESTERHGFDTRCGGCHGSLSGVAEDVFAASFDVVTTATATLARFEDRNPRRPRIPPVVGPETRKTLDFVEDVRPIIHRRCSTCHGDDVSHEALLPYVDAEHTRARTSPLMELVLGRKLDVPGPLPAHPSLSLTAQDISTLIGWIETGAHYRLPREEDAREEGP